MFTGSKLLSECPFTYKVLKTNQPVYLRKFPTIQPVSITHYSSVVTPQSYYTPAASHLYLMVVLYSYYAPNLPDEFRQSPACMVSLVVLFMSSLNSIRSWWFFHSSLAYVACRTYCLALGCMVLLFFSWLWSYIAFISFVKSRLSLYISLLRL
jgi:hypothetical protein